MSFQILVREFQTTGGESFPLHTATGTFIRLRGAVLKKRDTLFREERRETDDAFHEFNKAKTIGDARKWRIEILDGLCDMKYINDGSANLSGVILTDDAHEKVWGRRTYSIHKELHSLDGIDINEFERINAKIYKLAHSFRFSLPNFQEALARVHASNMSKFCKTEDEAIITQDAYKAKTPPVETYYKKVDELYVICRKEDDKILKSIKYHPVELADLIY